MNRLLSIIDYRLLSIIDNTVVDIDDNVVVVVVMATAVWNVADAIEQYWHRCNRFQWIVQHWQ